MFSQRGDKAEGQGKGCSVKEVTRLKAQKGRQSKLTPQIQDVVIIHLQLNVSLLGTQTHKHANTPVMVVAQSYMSPLHKHTSHGGGGPTLYVSTTQTHQSWWWWPNPICLHYTNTPVMVVVVVVAQSYMSPLHKHASHGGGGDGPILYVSTTQTCQSWWWW